jgi:hypothetical protein
MQEVLQGLQVFIADLVGPLDSEAGWVAAGCHGVCFGDFLAATQDGGNESINIWAKNKDHILECDFFVFTIYLIVGVHKFDPYPYSLILR